MSGEPRIRYAKTADGVSIAYYTMGSGPAVIDLGPPPASHLRMELQIPEIRAYVIVGALLSIIPLIIAFLGLQRFWRSGLGSGGLK